MSVKSRNIWLMAINFVLGMGAGIAVWTEAWAILVIVYACWAIGLFIYALSDDR